MLKTLWAQVKQGKIELLDPIELSEGTKVLVTLIPTTELERWLRPVTDRPAADASDTIWDTIEDGHSLTELLDAEQTDQTQSIY